MQYTFQASRISGNGNAVFPDKLIIESKGSQIIHAEGFSRSDAKQILQLLS